MTGDQAKRRFVDARANRTAQRPMDGAAPGWMRSAPSRSTKARAALRSMPGPGSGAISSSVEMAFFEMMRDASHDKFKEIQRLVK